MITEAQTKELNGILDRLADELDVPPLKYEDAKDRYQAVADWLGAEDSELAVHNPVIYPQGSFALGTAVRPLGDEDFDVDAVLLLEISKHRISQKELKALVGNRLMHPKSRYREMLHPPAGGRRCWTIKYADSSRFHLDVLPAVGDDYSWLINSGVPAEYAEHAICITDQKTWDYDLDWPKSNPQGYALWFKSRMRTRLDEAKKSMAELKKADVKDIEDFQVRTPLQRLVQLLKRHRDIMFNGDDDKPVSIIISTLAAHAYQNEAILGDAIARIVPRMRDGIEERNGVSWVENPVNPHENFADKWVENPAKKEKFYKWLDAVEKAQNELLTSTGFESIEKRLSESFGQRDVRSAMSKYADSFSRAKGNLPKASVTIIPAKSNKVEEYPRVEITESRKPWTE